MSNYTPPPHPDKQQRLNRINRRLTWALRFERLRIVVAYPCSFVRVGAQILRQRMGRRE